LQLRKSQETPVRTALITGTSSGFGLATTVELAARGWRVLATMRNLDKRGPLQHALQKSGLEKSVTIAYFDVTRLQTMPEDVDGLLSQAKGGLDAVIHNAGVAVGGAFEDLPMSEMRRVMETNFFGVLELTRLLLPVFRKQRRGRLILVSSDSAFAGEPMNTIYCASKWALEGWAESLAYEVGQFGIEVVLVEPGPYRTEIWNNSPWIKPPASSYANLLDQVKGSLRKHLDKNARDPKEVAETISDALEARRPRFRYPVGPIARASHFMRGKIPARLLRKFVAHYLGIDVANSSR
jgi:NAD(P)-dependent dehydrogenase (short-subunit alcohol dehydrogenase family)